MQPGELDAERFERARRGRAAGARPPASPSRPRTLLREALALWRGPPLADLAFEPFAQHRDRAARGAAARRARGARRGRPRRRPPRRARRRAARSSSPSTRRASGSPRSSCSRSTAAGARPRRSRPTATRAASSSAEVGVEPGPELRALQEAILRQDPSLEPEPRAAPSCPPELDAAAAHAARRARRRARLAARALGAARATGAGALVALTGAAGIGKTPARGRARRARSHRRGATSCTRPARARRRRSRARWAARARRRGRRCSSSTTPTRAGRRSRGAERRGRGDRGAPGARASRPASARTALARRDATLALEPLDARGGARRSRALYAPERDGRRRPREWLLEASGGVPAARPRGRRPVGAARGGAPRRRGRRARRRRAAPSCARWRTSSPAASSSSRRRASTSSRRTATAAPVVCPFKGLASFEVADAPYFFGRERLVAELVARLVGAPLLGVVGPSGSGKSSVVRAGLLPALAGGVLPGSEDWPQVADPARASTRCAELQRALAGLERRPPRRARRRPVRGDVHRLRRRGRAQPRSSPSSSQRRTGGDGARRRARDPRRLLRALRGATPSSRACSRRTTCSSARCGATSCGAPSSGPARARRAARRARARRRARRATSRTSRARCRCSRPRCSSSGSGATAARLRHAAYEDTGGVRGAVARLAEEAFGRLDAPQQELARRVLLRLRRGRARGRRRAPPRPARGARDRAAARTSRASSTLLADARLLTVSAGTVELAHEALLREWPRLRGWIEDDRDDLRVHREPERRGARVGPAGPRRRRAATAARGSTRCASGPSAATRRRRERRARVPRREHRRASAASAARAGAARRSRSARSPLGSSRSRLSRSSRSTSGATPSASATSPSRAQLALQSARRSRTTRSSALRLALWARRDGADRPGGGRAAPGRRSRSASSPCCAADSLDANAAAYSPDGTRDRHRRDRRASRACGTPRAARGGAARRRPRRRARGALLARRRRRSRSASRTARWPLTDALAGAAATCCCEATAEGRRAWRSAATGRASPAALRRRDGARARRSTEAARRCG